MPQNKTSAGSQMTVDCTINLLIINRNGDLLPFGNWQYDY